MDRFAFVALAILATILTGCASVSILPENRKTPALPWVEFKEMKAVYDMIEPGKTTRLQSNASGFKPEKFSGVQRLNYFETRKLIQGDNSQNFKVEDLPAGLQECYKLADRCRATIFKAEPKKSKEVGNFIANKTDFEVTTVTTGWMMTATFFMKLEHGAGVESDDDILLYKSTSDTPVINDTEIKKDPMGPFKSIGNTLFGAATKFFCFGVC